MSRIPGNYGTSFGRFQAGPAAAGTESAIVSTTRDITKMVIAICAGRVFYREDGCDSGSPVTVARAPIFFPSDFSISASVFTASCLP